MLNSVKNVEEETCCGCGACYQICSRRCIRMKQNERGFLIPVVDEEACINCGACVKVCPENVQPFMNTVQKAYVAIAKNKKILSMSTSGGIFGVLAENVITAGGIVYGCMWREGIYAQQVRIECIEELQKIQKSKYVQSDTKKTFIEVRKDLKSGKNVLYSGTACQIAGLRKFLNGNEGKLITIEVACHGVPSIGLFQKYICWKEKIEKEQVCEIQFRNKEKHKKGEHYKFCLKYKGGREQYFISDEDPYYGSFLEGKTLRKTCYHCKYKRIERISDILLGDYWGVEKEHPKFPAQNGASAVVIASNKGEQLFKSIEDKLIVEDSTFEKIVKHNKSIISCAVCPEEKRLESINVDDDSLFKILKPNFNIKKRIKNVVPERVKYLLKRLG